MPSKDTPDFSIKSGYSCNAPGSQGNKTAHECLKCYWTGDRMVHETRYRKYTSPSWLFCSNLKMTNFSLLGTKNKRWAPPGGETLGLLMVLCPPQLFLMKTTAKFTQSAPSSDSSALWAYIWQHPLNLFKAVIIEELITLIPIAGSTRCYMCSLPREAALGPVCLLRGLSLQCVGILSC